MSARLSETCLDSPGSKALKLCPICRMAVACLSWPGPSLQIQPRNGYQGFRQPISELQSVRILPSCAQICEDCGWHPGHRSRQLLLLDAACGHVVTQVDPYAVRPISAKIYTPLPPEKYGASTRQILRSLEYSEREVIELFAAGQASESWSREYFTELMAVISRQMGDVTVTDGAGLQRRTHLLCTRASQLSYKRRHFSPQIIASRVRQRGSRATISIR